MRLRSEHVQALRRRLNYLETERLGKMNPGRPGMKYDLAEAQALKAVLEADAKGLVPKGPDAARATEPADPLEEPPRRDEMTQTWSPGGVPKNGAVDGNGFRNAGRRRTTGT